MSASNMFPMYPGDMFARNAAAVGFALEPVATNHLCAMAEDPIAATNADKSCVWVLEMRTLLPIPHTAYELSIVKSNPVPVAPFAVAFQDKDDQEGVKYSSSVAHALTRICCKAVPIGYRDCTTRISPGVNSLAVRAIFLFCYFV